MKPLIALLLPLCLDGASGIEWFDDLDTACRKARDEKKLVLLRQVLCACKDTDCPYAEMARKPAYLDDADARKAVSRDCVAAVVRPTPDRDMEGLKDFGYGALLTKGAPLRTFLLTPDRHILHRLDFCSYSGDVAGEIEYAQLVRLTCFDSSGAPEATAAATVRRLHEDHLKTPKGYHKARGGAPASECRCPSPRVGPSGSWKPWTGYNRGILWHTDVEEAKRLARHSNRNLLYFQVVGDLYKEGC